MLFRADSGDDFLDIECTYFQGKERDAFDIRLDSFSVRKCPGSVSHDLVARARGVAGVTQ